MDKRETLALILLVGAASSLIPSLPEIARIKTENPELMPFVSFAFIIVAFVIVLAIAE